MEDTLLLAIGKAHPSTCPECDDVLLLQTGKFGAYYRCINFPDCSGSASAGADGTPLGTAVTADIKQKRIYAHAIFKTFCDMEFMPTVRKAHEWLADRIGTSHFGQMDAKQINAAVREIQRYMKETTRRNGDQNSNGKSR